MRTRKGLATIVAVVGPLVLGLVLLLRGPYDVTLVLVAPEGTSSSALVVGVWRGAEPVVRLENAVRGAEVTFPDGRVHDFRLSVRLPRGVYRVRAMYDTVRFGCDPPLDQVINVTRSETAVLRLRGTEPDWTRCR